MDEHLDRAVAVVGVGAIMPDAPDAAAFWDNIKDGRYSITDVDPARWDPDLYYDSDPKAPDKTYSKIGGWVTDWAWDPRSWKLPLMPRVADAMDDTQKWAVACTQQALSDYGYPERPLDNERVAVILGNAMAGELHYQTSLRINMADIAEELHETPSFRALANDVQRAITDELLGVVGKRYPEITEDTMPGELSNVIAGRVASLFNFRGPNFVIDAACASAMAATNSAVEGLIQGDFDAVIAGGVDRNMGAATYVKFCKVGALSATGTRPYAAGADGFVMGEGAAVFLLKRLRDAEQSGDRIYAVLLGLAGSSDGRGKGITAPNPVGQKLAVQRAWHKAGVPPETASLVEGHGTSTPVGDVVEHQSMAEVFGSSGAAPGSIALGSVKSNIGHLKGAAGAAGMFKVVMSLHEKVLPPSLNFRSPNPDIDFSRSPLRVNTELRDWEQPEAGVRRAGVSAFGFGGTNFHAVFEEYVPARANGEAKTFAVPEVASVAVTADVGRPPARAGSADAVSPGGPSSAAAPGPKAPLRGAAVVGAATEGELGERLAALAAEAAEGRLPPMAPPAEADLRAPERVAIDFGSAEELADKAAKAQKALTAGEPAWRMLRGRGVYRGRGPAPKVAFLYTGQGSQYANMLRTLAEHEPRVGEVFEEADRIMTPLLQGRPLRSFVFVDGEDPEALAHAEEDLRQTEITQPAVLTVDHALTRLLDAYGVRPDFVMGHSLGEYGALTAAGALPFEDALEAVSARGRGMANIDVEDRGLLAAVFAPLAEVERIVGEIDGNVVIANINSDSQAVIGGATEAVDRAMAALTDAGHQVVQLSVSHAFHTSIVAPASEPLKAALAGLRLRPPSIPVVANVSGDFYPMGPDARPEMLDILGRQVASPVQFVKGLHTLYESGARVFVEVGPKKSLQGFTEDVLGDEPDVLALFTNHPKWEDDVAFNQALCGLYASGLGTSAEGTASLSPPPAIHEYPPGALAVADAADDRAGSPVNVDGKGAGLRRPVVVSGAALGLPGTERVFDPSNVGRILRGEQLISAIPADLRDAILDQHITRLVKAPDGGGSFEAIDDAADVIKLAGRAQAFDPEAEFGIDGNRLPALDSTTCMAIAAGLDALNDAGIPLVQHYKTTTTGTQLPERWGLPDELRDDTGVIFASAFPGMDSFAGYAHDYYSDKARREQRAALESVRETVVASNGVGATPVLAELDRRIAGLRAEIDAHPYEFDRRFLFRVLSMGHSQFAEIIGARGPNTQVNAACASTTQAIGLAEDWIRAGRCRRVIVIAADNVTSDNLLGWVGAGFLVTGAAATDEVVEDAATPFDRRRHGMILGMGAAAIVVEEPDAVAERGIRPIAEVLSAVINNSAFHGTRLNVDHISQVMEHLVAQAEERWGIDRRAIASETMFVSHETYTPARGGSAAAEVASLRAAFGPDAGQIVMANTKGFTGHPMGVGIEDVVAIKALETGLVPPIPNFKEPDPDLGELNLSVGGSYPVRYALRLAAGFGSQISMVLFRWVPTPDGSRRSPEELGYEYRIVEPARWKSWLARVSGNPDPEVELVQHRLRVVDTGPAQTEPVDPPTTTLPRDDQAAPAPAAPAPAPVAPAVVAPVAVAVSEDEVRQRVLALVAAQTGYPEDMLDLDLDLEADLGVDTVKQAELFATVREAYGIAREDTLQLRDFPTLNHVIAFALDRAGAPAPAEMAPPAVAAPTPEDPTVVAPLAVAVAVSEDEVRQRVLALVAAQTGYPEDMLDLDLDLEADLGVDTVKQAELFATVREAYGIAREDTLQLRDFPTLNHVIAFALDRAGGARADEAPTAAEPGPSAVAAPAPETTPAAVSEDEVRQRVLALVAAQTGYPEDMLDLDLDLEADLGVDTVKQAELFATVREAYGIAREDTLQLRDFPTLNHVIAFALDRAGGARADEAPTAAEPGPSAVAAPAPETTPAAVSEDEVRQRVLALVAAQTGYPEDMLDLDLDLEADLGVDTVKQAELFATVREAYGIAREDTLQLRDFPTLNHVIAFALDRAGAPAPAETAPPAVAAPTPEDPTVVAPLAVAVAVSEDEVRQRVLALVAAQTGYPEDMLDLDLDLEADLGVDTVKQAELFATVREAYGIAREDTLQLRDFPTLNHVIAFALDRAGAPAPAETAPTAVAAPTPEDPTVVAPLAVAVAVSEDEVRQRVLALVAAQTGYPEDMLDLDLDLEADLGVDTVKQAELFATVREAYGIAREDTLQLRDFPTLNHVIAFALDRAGAPGVAEIAPPTAPAETATVSPEALSGLDQCDQVPRRLPTAVLRPPVELCRPTSVTLAAGSRVVVMPDRAGVADALVERLHQRGVDTLVLDRPADPGPGGHDIDSEALARQLQDWTTAGGPVTGVYWLAALDVEPPMADLDLHAWKEGLRVRVKLLAATMRALYDQVNVPGSFLVSATRLGGRHGYDEAGATAPMGGAVTGFTKAYKRERADAHIKAVDLEPTTAATDAADILLEETLRDPGAVEVGRHGGLRWTVGFEERPAADGRPGFPLSPDTVFVVTGAAGGIVSAIVADLATASGGTFHLLDLAPEPDPGDPDLERFQTDREGLKRDLFGRIKDRGERATPAMVERELSALERQRAALDAIVAIRKAGGEAHYHSLDLRDPEAVGRAIDDVRRRHGRVGVLLHAAGLEISRFLPDKTDDEYDLVFDVKSDGWFNLLHAIGDMPLGATVCFSSVAARFGNGGQTDYSAANDLLCKTTSSLRTTRPATRGIVIDWSAWGGIGMATRGSIPKMMEQAGIDMLPPDAGVPWARRELVTGGFRGEVLVGQRLGILVEEPDASNGLDRVVVGRLPHGPMVGEVTAMGVWRPLTVAVTLDPTAQAFLDHHRIDGTPVLPGAMGVEAFAEVASLMLPGWRVSAVEDVDFLAPFKFYRDQPRTLTLEATVTAGTGDELVAHCRLLGSRQLANQPEPQVSTHFTGRVRLSPATPGESTAAIPSAPQQGGVGAEAIYRVYFHGPAYQVLEGSWRDGDSQIGLLAASLPEHHQPPGLPLVTAPRLLELCFQTAGVWELGTSGRLALPRHLGRVTATAAGEPPTGRVYAVVTPGAGGETFDAMVVDETGRVHLRLEGYATVALPTPVDAALLAPLRAEVT